MLTLKGVSLSLLAMASTALAQTDKFCTSATKVCTTVNIPEGGEDLYLQISAPESSGWAGVGIGNRMAGALIFVVYPSDVDGEVTVSPRYGRGNIMPEYAEDINIQMLNGSGITGGNMIANFMCSNCLQYDEGNGEVDITSDEHPFIWAIGGEGVNIRSAEPDESFTQHSTKGAFSLNLVKATGGNGGNPFANSTIGPDADSGDSGSEDDDKTGLAPVTKAEKILFAHGITFAVASWLISSLF